MNSDMMTALGEYIATEILSQPDRKIADNEKLISSGLVDSLSLVDIAIFVEDHFQVAIDDTELNADTFDSLEELEKIILSRQP